MTIVILKFSTLKSWCEIDPNSNLKIFNLSNNKFSNNKFEPISNFQIKSSFQNMTQVYSETETINCQEISLSCPSYKCLFRL